MHASTSPQSESSRNGMKNIILLIAFGLTLALASPIARVEEKIWRNLEESELTNVLVTFRKAETKAAWDRFYSLRLTTREAILKTQHAILKDHADIVQADVTAILTKTHLAGKRHYLDQLWITTELVVRDVDRETVEMLRNHPDVESLVAEKFIPLERTEIGEISEVRGYNNTISEDEWEWGLGNIEAPSAWARGYNGRGIDIGSIDTGVRYTHLLLSSTYRGTYDGTHQYNWRAPTGNTLEPSDDDGHGTHTCGTHSGILGYGAAPGSRWLACRGCGTESCSTFDLSSCGNFMACPTNTAGGAPNCARAPHVVNNSWGGDGGQTWYNSILIAWRNAGISGVFAIGNAGTACSTAGSPGDQPLAFGVGSIANTNTLSVFSSVGPGPANAVKPDVAAPGTAIVSAYFGADNLVAMMSGTSMACPHVAGAIAIVLQAHGPGVVAAHNRLTSTATYHVSAGRTCSGRSEHVIPNNHVGYGRINVNAASQ